MNTPQAIQLYLQTFKDVCKPNELECKIFDKLVHDFFNTEPEQTLQDDNAQTETMGFKKK